MNRAYLVVLNVLITSIYSIAGPVDDVTTISFEDGNYDIDDQAMRIPDETDDVLPVLVRKDDLISTSNLNKIYTSLEHKFAKTRLLKDETENEGFKNAAWKQVSHTVKSKSAKRIDDDPKERSDTTETEGIETKTDKRVGSKSSEGSSTTIKSGEKSKHVEQESGEQQRSGTAAEIVGESESATKEENNTLERSDTAAKVDESKNTKKEESKTGEFTSELNEFEKTTRSFRREVKDTDYLENNEYEVNDKVATNQDSERKGYEILVNDESNSSWDVLDDLPASRRMISQPDNLNIEVKAKAANEIAPPLEARNVLDTKITSRNHISHSNMFGPPATPMISIPQFRGTVSVPHIHQALLPQRRFIVPGFIKVPPVVPKVTVDIRRLLNQEGNNFLNRNIQHETDNRYDSNNVMNQNRDIVLNPNERSEVPPFRDVIEDYKSEDFSNAYGRPYAPVDLYSPKTPQASPISAIVTKLIEASEHPQRSTPNVNREYVQNFPNIPYKMQSPDKNSYNANNGGNMQNYPSVANARPNSYAVQQNYGGFKYVTGFGRPR